MSISGVTGPDGSSAYAMKVVKLAQDQAKVEGRAAVALIEQSRPPTAEHGGRGGLVDTYG